MAIQELRTVVCANCLFILFYNSGITGLGRTIDANGDANANVSVFTIQRELNSTYGHIIAPVAIFQDYNDTPVSILNC